MIGVLLPFHPTLRMIQPGQNRTIGGVRASPLSKAKTAAQIRKISSDFILLMDEGLRNVGVKSWGCVRLTKEEV